VNDRSVSILLPVRNAAATLAAALASIRAQVGVDWECVCVDDGSTDATPEILQTFALADRRIRVVRQSARGIVAALQLGLDHCHGNLIARMDADDLMHPWRLACQTRALLADPSLAGVGCRVQLFPEQRVGQGYRRYVAWLDRLLSPEDLARERFRECPLVHPTWVLRREVLLQCSYQEVPWPEDYDLILRLFASGHRLACLPERLHFWRMHPGRTSASHPSYSQMQIAQCKAFHLAQGPLRYSRHYLLWGYGPTARRLMRALACYKKEPIAIVDVHPRRLGARIGRALVVGPHHVDTLPRLPLLVSVANDTARDAIRMFLAHSSRVEGHDWFFTA